MLFSEWADIGAGEPNRREMLLSHTVRFVPPDMGPQAYHFSMMVRGELAFTAETGKGSAKGLVGNGSQAQAEGRVCTGQQELTFIFFWC